MFVKQIDLNEALRLAAKGKEVKVLVPNGQDGAWEGMFPTTIGKMLDGCLFFRQEPAMINPEFEAAVQAMEGQNPPNADGDAAGDSRDAEKQPGKRVGASGKRKEVDTGKILALHNAGWTNKAIAEEMKMDVKSVWYYIGKARKGKQDENG